MEKGIVEKGDISRISRQGKTGQSKNVNEDVNIIMKLHPLERKVLPYLEEGIKDVDIEKKSGMKHIEIMRALQWLENKGIVNTEKISDKIVTLGKNGERYKKELLPEERFIRYGKEVDENKEYSFDEIKKITKIKDDEFNILLGIGRRLGIIELNKGKIKIHKNNFKLVKSGQPLLEKLPKKYDDLDDLEKHYVIELKKRKDIINIEDRKFVIVHITDKGKEILRHKEELNKEYVESLTPEMLKSGSWKGKEFRHYDVSINVPKVHGGKRHFVNQAIEYIRRIWIEMGFKEMTGSLIQNAFWDLDVLFVPQDHPARTMQDTYYVESDEKIRLPEWYENIKEIHENGGDTKSRGWQYGWSKEESEKVLLRTHTTVLSAQTLWKLRNEKNPEGKYFSVGKVFRNETLDWKHLFEFYQVEGIVIGKDANLSQLQGLLKEFYRKMGYSDVRMRPGHFPYTEPSMEVDGLHSSGRWIELGGSGIFRPEVTIALLGKEVPVLAWGLGMARIISSYWSIKDIRDLYKNDLKQMKELKIWLK